MGTTNKSVDKQSGKVPPKVKADAEKLKTPKKRTLSVREVMAAMGMSSFFNNNRSKHPESMAINKPKFKKRKRRLQKQDRKNSRK